MALRTHGCFLKPIWTPDAPFGLCCWAGSPFSGAASSLGTSNIKLSSLSSFRYSGLSNGEAVPSSSENVTFLSDWFSFGLTVGTWASSTKDWAWWNNDKNVLYNLLQELTKEYYPPRNLRVSYRSISSSSQKHMVNMHPVSFEWTLELSSQPTQKQSHTTTMLNSPVYLQKRIETQVLRASWELFINQFTSGIYIFFLQSPVRDYFQWKFERNL